MTSSLFSLRTDHFGAAIWVSENFSKEIETGEVAFSGSSGGAIVAACTTCRLDLDAIVGEVIRDVYYRCKYKPWNIPQEVPINYDYYFGINPRKNNNVNLRVSGRFLLFWSGIFRQTLTSQLRRRAAFEFSW